MAHHFISTAFTPDVLRNAIVDADRRILDFRITQTAADRIEFSLAADLPGEVSQTVLTALRRALSKLGAGDVAIDFRPGIPSASDRKLRRVRRDWRPHG